MFLGFVSKYDFSKSFTNIFLITKYILPVIVCFYFVDVRILSLSHPMFNAIRKFISFSRHFTGRFIQFECLS